MISIPRSAAEQAEIERETARLALYQYAMCPFCVRVKRTIKELGLDIEMHDTLFDAKARDELYRGGGSTQVPCLRITEDDGSVTWMYESGDIIRYLQERFGA